MRRWLRWCLYALAALLIVSIGVVAFIQTGPGKRLLAARLSSILSTPESGIEISEIEGWIPLDLRVNAFRLRDRDGVWLEADGITFDWSPSALLSGRVQIDQIGADHIEIMRPPLAADPPEPVSDEPFRLPELPKSLIPVTVERLALAEIVLGAPVLGEAASFSLEGSVRGNNEGDKVTARLDLLRTDKQTASATLEAIASLDPLALDLDLKANEGGGLIADLAGQPQMGNVDLSLEGEGPLDDWAGRLHGEAEGLAALEANLGLALADQPRLAIEGGVEPSAGALPETIASLIGERLSIDLDVVQIRAQALDIRKADLATSFATLDAEGAIGFDDGDLTLRASLAAADLAPLGPLVDADLSGEADLLLLVDGSLSAPDGKLDLRVVDPAFDGNSAEAIANEIRWTTTTPLDAEGAALDVVIEGEASGLAIPGTVLPDDQLRLSGSLALPLEGDIGIERIALETAGSSLTATGAFDPAQLEGMIDLALDAPSLARLASPYGAAIEGKALIKTAIRMADQAKDITVDLDAGLSELAGLPPGAAELLGQEATLQVKVTRDSANTLELTTLAFDGAEIALEGQASADLDQKDIDGRITLALPDLGALAALIPDGVAGKVKLEADLGGNLDAPAVNLRITSQDLVVAGEPIATFGLTMTGQDLIAAPNGDLDIEVDARETPATLALAYRLADGVLDLDAIDLKAPETELGGALSLALETTLVEGALKGRIADLSALAPLIQQPLAGSIDLDAKVTPDGDRQTARLSLDGRAIDGDFGGLKTLDVDAAVTDALGQPAIDAKVSLTGFEQGTTALDALTLTARGQGESYAFDLDVAGEVLKPLEIAAKGGVNLAGGVEFGLESLNGSFAGEPLRLARPLTLRQGESGLALADLDLRLGDARLQGDVDIGDKTVKGAIDLRELPLRWSEVFDGPSLSGNANADIDLSGNVASPKVVASLNVDGLLAKSVAPGDLKLDMSLDARLDRGRLAANFQASGLTQNPITATASLPAELSLEPFAFNLPENGELSGRIDAELLLERLADLLALDDQSMSGRLYADLVIGGTLAGPKVRGPVILENAEYEHGASGSRIKDLNMRAIASDERIEVESLTGKTGKSGRLEAEGWLDLDPEADFPHAVTLRLNKAKLVDRDDVEGRISGEIAMIGDLSGPEIKGDLKVERAEISIPDGVGPTVPDIEVEEVGGYIVNPPPDETSAEAQEEKPFDPMLNIRISLPNKIYVRGRGLESEWRGDLRIAGPASSPTIVGNLGIKKGHFDFLDKRFELALGEITFSGETPPNPIIALEARAEDDDFTAIIKLNGPADDPQILLTSEPALPEDEILARLMFNRELSQIGPVEAAKLAFAVNRLRGGGGFDAFGEIRGILKIDTLDVVSDEEGDTAVKVGKYLNDDVYVEVEKGAGEQSGRARVEIELLPNVSLEADTSEDANSGVGLKWKFDY